MKKLILLAVCSCATFASAQNFAPFGLKRGMTIAELLRMGAKASENPGYFSMKTVPQPNGAFDLYSLKASKTHGLCRISGLGITLRNDTYGEKTQGAFNNMETALNSKYGKGKRFDFLHADSIWDEPEDWLMSLEEDERTLATYWDAEEKSKLPAGLTSIVLRANSLSSTEGYITVSYELSNYDACTSEIKRSSGGSGNSGDGL